MVMQPKHELLLQMCSAEPWHDCSVYAALPHLLLLLILLLHQPTFRESNQSKALINNAGSW
jgi:hypothetical protein